MILADTSAWVEYDRATGSAVHRRVVELISADVDLAVTEPVIMEVPAARVGPASTPAAVHPPSLRCRIRLRLGGADLSAVPGGRNYAARDG